VSDLGFAMLAFDLFCLAYMIVALIEFARDKDFGPLPKSLQQIFMVIAIFAALLGTAKMARPYLHDPKLNCTPIVAEHGQYQYVPVINEFGHLENRWEWVP
jgi:hypothetical protein